MAPIIVQNISTAVVKENIFTEAVDRVCMMTMAMHFNQLFAWQMVIKAALQNTWHINALITVNMQIILLILETVYDISSIILYTADI